MADTTFTNGTVITVEWLQAVNDYVYAGGGALGTMSTQNANAVAITGGSVTGITDLAVADGGTGASTAGDARTNLGATATGSSLFTAATAAAARSAISAAASGANTDITSLSAPALGAATATTQSQSDNSTKVATTAYVDTAVAAVAITVHQNYLTGLTLSNNSGDATNDIDIAAGQAADSTNAVLITLASGLTKRLDANWSVGTNQGGLDTGSIANGTYHVFLIQRSDTGVEDILFSTSASSPTMPASYDYKRRIGSILRESAAIVGFVQDGDEFWRKSAVLTINSSTAAEGDTTYTLAVPTGIRVKAMFNAYHLGGDNNGARYFSDLSRTTQNASYTTGSAPSGHLDTDTFGQFAIWTNTSGQIRGNMYWGGAGAAGSFLLQISDVGWIDYRGRHG